MGFEDNLQRGMFSMSAEKTYIDKVIGKEDIERLRELVKKHPLTRNELLEILYLLSSSESKMLNYSAWDRYVILKYFVWIREFIKIIELSYDYRERLETEKIELDKQTTHMFENISNQMEHNAKFLIDLYLNIARTSLSLGGTGFDKMMTNNFEMSYINPPGSMQIPEKKSLFTAK